MTEFIPYQFLLPCDLKFFIYELSKFPFLFTDFITATCKVGFFLKHC